MEQLWIDAVDFDDYGGFVLETQFVREMGQSYLLATGVGTPVKPASVTFHVTEGGMYRFHIRTKNWYPDCPPDGLILEIDGEKSGHICSRMHINGWYFEVGADIFLKKGAHTLKVYDTEGWFGRFACLVITNDYDFTPSRELGRLMQQRAAIKGLCTQAQEQGTFDLIVAGAGVAGVVAAITAARYGLKTALINDRPLLGGNAAEEANVNLEGAAHRGRHETGIVLEIKNYRHHHKCTWSEAFLHFADAEENLTVFSDTLITQAHTENNRITQIEAIHTHTLKNYRFSAPYYVDATGDGWLGYYAGAAYRIGREAKFQHRESFAPENADGNTMSGCATLISKHLTDTLCGYQACDTGAPVQFHAPGWAFKMPEGDNLGRKPDRLDVGAWWMEMPGDYDDVFENEYTRDNMLRMAAGYFDWLKNSWPDREKAANYALTALGTYNAKRESRRLMGDHILTENDYTEGTSFPDAVCYSGWAIDVHHIKGIFSGPGGKYAVSKRVPITPIPFGALYSKNIKNLMMAGRCISVSHLGLGPIRVMLTGGTMGQAVGTAAYLCKLYSQDPRDICRQHIQQLQQLLLKDGMSIPGILHADENDLARCSTVTATSFAPGGDPSNVLNDRMQRQDGDDYAWISKDPMPQSITLHFDRVKTVQQVRITLDIPFDQYKYGYMAQPVPQTLITDLTLSVLTENGWQDTATVTHNIQRLIVLDFAPTKVTAVKITAHKALDFDKAVIPHIRIY